MYSLVRKDPEDTASRINAVLAYIQEAEFIRELPDVVGTGGIVEHGGFLIMGMVMEAVEELGRLANEAARGTP